MNIGAILLGWGITVLLVLMAVVLLVESGVIKISISWEEKEEDDDDTGVDKGSDS